MFVVLRHNSQGWLDSNLKCIRLIGYLHNAKWLYCIRLKKSEIKNRYSSIKNQKPKSRSISSISIISQASKTDGTTIKDFGTALKSMSSATITNDFFPFL